MVPGGFRVGLLVLRAAGELFELEAQVVVVKYDRQAKGVPSHTSGPHRPAESSKATPPFRRGG
jgi:hypothetical protein